MITTQSHSVVDVTIIGDTSESGTFVIMDGERYSLKEWEARYEKACRQEWLAKQLDRIDEVVDEIFDHMEKFEETQRKA